MISENPSRPLYARWRFVSLLLVHVLFALHIVHWKVAGRTLAPLELNELMYTLEAGIITAGFLFMVLVCLSVLVFGRFFCSWGCHILALQDLCSWIMEKLGVRPRVVRTKALLCVPLVAMLYMFVWPQLEFLLFERARPELHVTGEESGWASFVTSDYWRNLPPPGIALFTFAVCGFGFVYMMGHRSFCKYACPYGAIFSLLDRVAPGRISKTGDCSACGLCTAACTSDIQVHEELAAHGQVIDSACLRDLDCLNACPDAAIGFRFKTPPLFRNRASESPAPKPSMFSRGEEWAIAIAFVPLVLALRGLYGIFPFLLTLAAAGMLGYLGVLCKRLISADSVKFVRYQLKRAGRVHWNGWLILLVGAACAVFVTHSAAIRFNAWRGAHAVQSLAAEIELHSVESGIAAYEFVEAWGLLRTPNAFTDLGRLQRARGEWLAQEGQLAPALESFEQAVTRLPDDPVLRFNLGRLLSQFGRLPEAIAQYEVAAELDPLDAEVQNNLGYLRMSSGEDQAAQRHFERSIQLDAEFAHPHFNLGRIHFERGDEVRGLGHFRQAAKLDPTYAEWLAEFEADE